jgi:hypothetical protein
MLGGLISRFTSPDPALISAKGTEPQTWNRYSYVTNNPLRYSDPLGLWKHEVQDVKKDGEVVGKQVVFVRTNTKDNAESLLKQLGYSKDDKNGKKILDGINEQLKKGETVHGAKLAGVVGRTFKIADEGLTSQFKDKINTPSGRKKGAKQLPSQERATGKKGRVVYYDPTKQ